MKTSAADPTSILIPVFKENVALKMHRHEPVYSVPDATEEVVDAFSQSFSPFRLPQRLGDKKPSTDSDLHSRENRFYVSSKERTLGGSEGYV